MRDLLEIRDEIDKIDKDIVSLLKKRLDLSDEVAKFKLKTGKDIYDRDREKEKLEKIESFADNDFLRISLRELFTQIMSISRKYQYKKINKVKKPIKELELKKDRVGFFGGSGTYTERAMKNFFGDELKGRPYDSFEGVCIALEKEEIDCGILPIENSTTGSISDIYDLLVKYKLYIVGEEIQKIDHALLGLPSANIADITTVYSHAQPLLQCSNFLKKHIDWDTIAYGSTSKCADKIIKDNNSKSAVIASKRNADLYGLKVLAGDIANDTENFTRFIVLSKNNIYKSTANKISICFEIPHIAGSLYDILSNFIYNGINMTRIESRPIPSKRWQYRFFVDFEGNLNEAGVLNLITALGYETNSFTILGNYISANK